jgi:hypothetical protein
MSQDDPTVPDTAMATGSDAGEPGDRSGGPPLDAGERALLHDLVEGTDAPDVVHDAPEDSAAAARAADDDAPLSDYA